MISPAWLGIAYGCTEAAITIFKRSQSASSQTDRGSLRMIWFVIGASVTSSVLAEIFLPFAYFGGEAIVYWTGIALFVAGLALRWYSIAYLGRFFTVDVAVGADQYVVDSGPYRFIRHPSYSGGILAFAGLGLYMANYLALLLLVVPTAAVFLYRIRIEEAALLSGLGEPYRKYMSRTKRLIPLIY